MDEPTNHLDRAGRDFIAEIVASFKGGLLIVSHDRELWSAWTASSKSPRSA